MVPFMIRAAVNVLGVSDGRRDRRSQGKRQDGEAHGENVRGRDLDD